MLTNKRIGSWAWTLTAEEGLTALLVGRSLRENASITPAMKLRYGRMLEKQKKLLALDRACRPPIREARGS